MDLHVADPSPAQAKSTAAAIEVAAGLQTDATYVHRRPGAPSKTQGGGLWIVEPGQDLSRACSLVAKADHFIAFATSGELPQFARLWQAKADGYVLKSYGHRRLVQAARQVLSGERFAPPRLLSFYEEIQEAPGLSQKQKRWARLALEGYGHKEIAERMDTSYDDARRTKSYVREKLQWEDDDQMQDMLQTKLL